MANNVRFVGNARGESRPGVWHDPAIRLLMEYVDTGDVEVGDLTRELMPLRRYGVQVTPEIMQKAIDKVIAAKRDQPPKPTPRSELPAVVYYMRIGNRVKIGTSTNLTERLKTINPEELLATEPGGIKLERKRHREFADLRVNGEWFKLEGPLAAHITKLVETR